MIIKCNINEEMFKIDYSGKFILVDYKNYFLKHAEEFYVDLKYDGDSIEDLVHHYDAFVKAIICSTFFNKVPKWT
ncbi:MAG TPA: hypothetical protein PLH46_02965 [Caldisericia bacterium]|nr:hypothetical protein [Methanofastidiosum sp.]HQJ56583.1 hypothetical protein [Caldisericia bacterium]